MIEATEPRATPWTLLTLAVWIVVAGLLMLRTPGPPEPPAADPEEAAISERLTQWALRDARQWQEERGDFGLAWEDAEGHLAIVIDDVGRELLVFERLLALRWRLTFSVLPGAPYAAGVQLRLAEDRRRYREVLLHLPSEPLGAEAMDRGAEQQESFLRVDDPAPLLQLKVLQALVRVPKAVGINNHMGSRFTADPDAMAAIMPVLERRGLFWLDSRTTPETVAVAQARAAGVPVISRQIFLDHDPAPAAIEAAMREAVERSRHEPVVVIGHPSPAVAEVLARTLPEAHASGVGVYPLSELLVRTQGGGCPTCAEPPPT